jgi:hypothetical protein
MFKLNLIIKENISLKIYSDNRHNWQLFNKIHRKGKNDKNIFAIKLHIGIFEISNLLF